jgi:hypothetical protein
MMLDAAGFVKLLVTVPVSVRIRELIRTDDGVLGYFVDDYSRFTPSRPSSSGRPGHRAASGDAP